MANLKKQLRNVAFGGNWSEDIPAEEELRRAINVMEKTAKECAERDGRNEELMEAIHHIRRNMGNRQGLCESFLRALSNENPNLRRMEAKRIARLIRNLANI
ncbi:MAG: hypothetical protein OXD29_06500 [Roseovarius sp.]|nr:hypothetical protein [Roseovarius sp.]MCY4316787.1 hypothetical protein [Roseovarius sp.]